jgi:hypothetical protein
VKIGITLSNFTQALKDVRFQNGISKLRERKRRWKNNAAFDLKVTLVGMSEKVFRNQLENGG